MLTASFLRHLESSLSKKFKSILHIRRVTPVSGGSINLAAKIDTTAGTFFLKANDEFKYPSMFQKEVAGLEAIRATHTFSVPNVILTGDDEGQAYLILEFINSKPRNASFWEVFGRSLAEMHKHTNEKFGFVDDNYIGSLKQSNRQRNTWIDFFIDERIEPQLKLASSKGLLNETDIKHFQKLFSRLSELIPAEPPAFLHGDLWSGNFISGNSGEPCLIDPAVYFGHREMDLSMSKLFGGFDTVFYEVYEKEFPLEAGFEDRVLIHNLYPLLVHVNLFGGGYVNEVRQICKRYF